jgi:hypothetical protein
MSKDLTDCEQELDKLQEDHTRLVEENDTLRDTSIFFGHLAERLNAQLHTDLPQSGPAWAQTVPPVPAVARLRPDRRAVAG